MKRFVYFFTIVGLAVLNTQCKKPTIQGNGCIAEAISWPPTFSFPAWHPNGKILAFDYVPLQDSLPYGNSPCVLYDFSYSTDSSGFWLCNSDGSGMRKVYGSQLNNPSWSPDGKWLLFDTAGAVYKMPFDGTNFDTTAIVALASTSGHACINACWNPSGDTIYYNSAYNAINFIVWKMAADGTGKTPVGDTTFAGDTWQPACLPNGNILFVRYVGPGPDISEQIFSMDAAGGQIKQITDDNDLFAEKLYPRYYNNKIFYEAQGVNSVNTDGSGRQILCHIASEGYSISPSGVIAYTNYGGEYIGYNEGNMWTMYADGTNNKPFLYNK